MVHRAEPDGGLGGSACNRRPDLDAPQNAFLVGRPEVKSLQIQRLVPGFAVDEELRIIRRSCR